MPTLTVTFPGARRPAVDAQLLGLVGADGDLIVQSYTVGPPEVTVRVYAFDSALLRDTVRTTVQLANLAPGLELATAAERPDWR